MQFQKNNLLSVLKKKWRNFSIGNIEAAKYL